jgi:hypothetical protein
MSGVGRGNTAARCCLVSSARPQYLLNSRCHQPEAGDDPSPLIVHAKVPDLLRLVGRYLSFVAGPYPLLALDYPDVLPAGPCATQIPPPACLYTFRVRMPVYVPKCRRGDRRPAGQLPPVQDMRDG